MKKFIKGHSDGIILAKVAIDRLLEFGNQETAEFIKEILNDNKWVILPLSIFPTAAGQGAIGIEIKNNRKNLLNFLNKINNLEHYNNVLNEKKIKKENRIINFRNLYYQMNAIFSRRICLNVYS